MLRHLRQIRLEGIGESGQERIARASVTVTDPGLVGEVATRYLVGAGVGRLAVPDERLARVARDVDPGVDVRVQNESGAPSASTSRAAAFGLADPATQAVARGALIALTVLRQELARERS